MAKFFMVLGGLIVGVIALVSIIHDDNEFSFLVVLLGIGALSTIPFFLYYEISFLVRGARYQPKIYESIALSLFIGIPSLCKAFSVANRGGEGGFGLIYLSIIFFFIFIAAGLSVAEVYRKRDRSLFKK